MTTIAISVNEVLRDFIGQLTYTYDKYVDKTEIKEGDVTSLDLIKFFPFKDINELNTFLYLEAPLEIFGHADQMSDGLMTHFNNFLMDMKDDGEYNVKIVSREINKSIPSTYFFLSKIGCRAENIQFVQDAIKEWDGCDILITANPDALNNKPTGKISIKINSSYNKDVKADYELDSILEFIRDENFRSKVFNTQITNYEEI
jgi:5'(3')-deoxyribonucleotidase